MLLFEMLSTIKAQWETMFVRSNSFIHSCIYFLFFASRRSIDGALGWNGKFPTHRADSRNVGATANDDCQKMRDAKLDLFLCVKTNRIEFGHLYARVCRLRLLILLHALSRSGFFVVILIWHIRSGTLDCTIRSIRSKLCTIPKCE